jgi:hypothetical protein
MQGFVHARTIPRFSPPGSNWGGLGVLAIKRGDKLRIVYPNGSIWDFEVLSRCAPTIGPACTVSLEPERVFGPMQRATVAPVVVADARDAGAGGRDGCDGRGSGEEGGRYVEFKTGFWEETVAETSVNVWSHTSSWRDTGPAMAFVPSLDYGGRGCR